MNPPIESERKAATRLSREYAIAITRSQIRYWKSKGYPLHDPAALLHCLRNSERPPAGLPASIASEAAPDSVGDISVEDAARHERQLGQRLLRYMEDLPGDITRAEIEGALACALYFSYMNYWGKLLGGDDSAIIAALRKPSAPD